MCGLDDVKIFSPNPQNISGQPIEVGEGNPIQGPSLENENDITTRNDDVIDTSNHNPQPVFPDAELQTQLDRLIQQSAEQSFRSIGKEELELALHQSHLNCLVKFEDKSAGLVNGGGSPKYKIVSLEYAIQAFNALPDQGKGSVEFAGMTLTSADKALLYSAIRYGQLQENLENEKLMKLQARAENAMMALSCLDCDHNQLANPNSGAAKMVQKAIDAQLKLGDMLMERINSSPIGDTTVFEEMQRRCMMRASELHQLANELARLATSDHYKTGAPLVVQEENPNEICTSTKVIPASQHVENTVVLEEGKDNSALFQKSFVSLLKGMASKMHGMDMLGNLQAEMSGMLQQLAAFQKGKPDEKALLEISQWEASVNHSRQILKQARENGMRIGQGDSVVRLDEAILDRMDKILEEGLRFTRDIKKGVFGLVLKKVIHAEIGKFPLTELDGHEALLQQGNWSLIKSVHEKLKALREAFTELTDNYGGQASLEKLRNAAREVKELTMSQDFYSGFSMQYMVGSESLRFGVGRLSSQHPDDASLKELAKKLEEAYSYQKGGNCFKRPPLNLLARQCQTLDNIVNHIVLMVENYDQRINFDERESNRMYDAVFHGKLPIETAVEARIHNVALEDVAQGTSDAERVSIDKIGEGANNSVFRCQYQDGHEYVFKPEILGRSALNNMAYVSGTEAFQSQQTIINLNVATVKCAELLGLGKRVVATKGGVVNGKFGILMEVAKGRNHGEWDTFKGHSEMKAVISKVPGGKKRVYGQIQRQLNELHWLDLLTGQVDRHWNNYKLDIREDGSVEIQGFDNDCCFGDITVGVNVFELNGSRMKKLCDGLKEGVENFYGNCPEAQEALDTIQEQILDKLPPGSKPGSFIVDLNQHKNIFLVNEIKKVIGCQSYSLPDKISQQTYDHLMKLKANPQLLEEALGERVSEVALAATKKRLQDLCDYAETLEQEGKLLKDDNAWEDSAMAQNLLVPQNQQFFSDLLADQGLPPMTSSNISYFTGYLTSISQDYFQRDYKNLCENVLN